MYSDNQAGDNERNTYGNINYLIYKVNDCVSLGQRFEWFNYGGEYFGGAKNDDVYNYTLGVNYKQSANLMFRPEVRWVWDRNDFGFNEQINGDNQNSQAAVGGDMLFTF
jgi:hypothetical protein